LPCAAYLNGEYGLNDIYMGVPCLLCRSGVENVVELKLTQEETAALHHSACEVQEGMEGLRQLGLV